MYSPDELESREAQRLNKALQGKLGSQQNKPRPVSSKWDPVQVKAIPGIPVNSTSSNNLKTDFANLSVGASSTPSSSGVDTSSPYAHVAGITVSDEKLKQEQQRLKKWGLSSEDNTTSETIPSYQPINSSSSSVTFNASGDIVSSNPSTPQKIVPSASQENLVDNTSIMGNVDGHTSSEKMAQEAKRLERWGLKINTNNITSPTSSTASTPAATSTTPSNQSVPSSPFTSSVAQSTNHSSNITSDQVKQFLDRIIFSAKSVKLILHKKSSNVDSTIHILLELVKESANFGINLNAESSMSFDISQNAGKLAGAVNELVIKSKDSEFNPRSILEEILSLLGLLYLGVVAN